MIHLYITNPNVLKMLAPYLTGWLFCISTLFLKTSPHFFCHSLLRLLFHWPVLPHFLHSLFLNP